MANLILVGGTLVNLDCIAWAEMSGREGPAEEGFDEATLVIHFNVSKTDGQGKTHTYTFRDADAVLVWEHILRRDITVLRPWAGDE